MTDPTSDHQLTRAPTPHCSQTTKASVHPPAPTTSLAPGVPRHVPGEILDGGLTWFTNRERPYALQQADGSCRWVYEPVARTVLQAHLTAEVTLALSSSDARGRCRWVCLDVDVRGSLPLAAPPRPGACA
jgi:hypothetical protein